MESPEQQEIRDWQRKRGFEPGAGGATESNSMAAMLEELMPALRTQIMGGVDQSLNRMGSQMAEMPSKYDSGVQSQFAAQQRQITDISKQL